MQPSSRVAGRSSGVWRLLRLIAAVGVVLGIALSIAPGGAPAQVDPSSCSPGFVWRQAVPGDRVCVTADTQTQVIADNAQANARRSPDDHTYGPDTCLQGYVWREAVPGDHVCVTPATRAQTTADNGQAAARTVAGAATPRAASPTPSQASGSIALCGACPLLVLRPHLQWFSALTVGGAGDDFAFFAACDPDVVSEIAVTIINSGNLPSGAFTVWIKTGESLSPDELTSRSLAPGAVHRFSIQPSEQRSQLSFSVTVDPYGQVQDPNPSVQYGYGQVNCTP